MADKKPNYIFGESAVRTIVRDHLRLRSELQALQETAIRNRQAPPTARYYVGKASGTISAISGTTLGTGTVNVYYRRTSDNVLIQSPLSLAVYNQAGEIANDTVVGISKDAWGDWYVTVEDCTE